jgi:hypothetical protein
MQNNLPVREVTELILSCDPDVFFETLINNLRNEVCSHQTFMRKAKFKKIESTKNKLAELKKDYTANSVRIQETEQILNNLIDMEMRSELFKYKHFDILNAEKISPRFLSLAKIKAKEVPLSIIKDDNGMHFLRDLDRNNYIANFYAGIYKDDSSRRLEPDAIRNFLGADICESPVVRNNRLTAEEAVIIK